MYSAVTLKVLNDFLCPTFLFWVVYCDADTLVDNTVPGNLQDGCRVFQQMVCCLLWPIEPGFIDLLPSFTMVNGLGNTMGSVGGHESNGSFLSDPLDQDPLKVTSGFSFHVLFEFHIIFHIDPILLRIQNLVFLLVYQYGLNRIYGVTFYLEKLQEASNVVVGNGVHPLVNFNIFFVRSVEGEPHV
jgi:hypothetical protein